ncbi:MAG: galactonate dehydratase [Alphaproteobacteria bacterium]|nr:MAG: galactonate dehydratase [Alphaproteobacteria bacterium]
MNIIRLHDNDNVAIAKNSIMKGQPLSANITIIAKSDIPAMHKIALEPIGKGENIRRYNQLIGVATRCIEPGEHVHVHNCGLSNVQFDNGDFRTGYPAKLVDPANQQVFKGFRRKNSKAGTRNYIGILSTVNCSATVARQIASAFQGTDILNDYPNVDGVVALTHTGGCSMLKGGPGYINLLRTLSGYVRHPNFGGILIIGLGCEVMQLGGLMDECGLDYTDMMRRLIIQEEGGTKKSLESGIKAVQEMLTTVNIAQRELIPVSEITLALQCGGSDAFSGMTANPALGCAVDHLVHQGGTAILSETPEIYGAEHLLASRSVSKEVTNALAEKILWWKDYTSKFGENIENNPSPGNKAGGLTTILEKSLGAVSKGGSTTLMGVYEYAEPIASNGLVFMDSPGFDPVSVTGQVASGATIVCFTTGRGSAFGFKPTPTIKLASNTPLYLRQLDDMDINCGRIADGEDTIETMGGQIFERIITIASGEKTKSEILGYGDNEYTPWHVGPIL